MVSEKKMNRSLVHIDTMATEEDDLEDAPEHAFDSGQVSG